MLKKLYLFLLFFCLADKLIMAQPFVDADSLLKILQIKEAKVRDKQIVSYIKSYFLTAPTDNLPAAEIEISSVLSKNKVPAEAAFEYYMESIYQGRLSHDDISKEQMIQAIQAAGKCGDDYLSCTFLNFLAYKQTEEGDVIGAVFSYRMAKKDAIKIGDINLQLIIDINISDVYYKNDFYGQSLFYLDQALAINDKFWPDDHRIKNIIYYNKCENFFRMNKPDSLLVYNQKLKNSKANTYKLYTYKNRTDYYISLLNRDYKKAISLIHAMQNDEGYIFDDRDLQNLSDAFYKDGQLDSAKSIINLLLSKPSEANHPEINYHLYELLADIAERQHNYQLASANFKLALQQAKDNMGRLTQVDDVSSLIKVDEVESYYAEKNETYQTERMWLIVTVISAVLVILVVTMFYRTIKQRRHYEKLLFAAKKEELAFINSHDVRKHLTNILGLIDLVQNSENKEKEFSLAEDFLFHSALELDKSIRNISEKLDD